MTKISPPDNTSAPTSLASTADTGPMSPTYVPPPEDITVPVPQADADMLSQAIHAEVRDFGPLDPLHSVPIRDGTTVDPFSLPETTQFDGSTDTTDRADDNHRLPPGSHQLPSPNLGRRPKP